MPLQLITSTYLSCISVYIVQNKPSVFIFIGNLPSSLFWLSSCLNFEDNRQRTNNADCCPPLQFPCLDFPLATWWSSFIWVCMTLTNTLVLIISSENTVRMRCNYVLTELICIIYFWYNKWAINKLIYNNMHLSYLIHFICIRMGIVFWWRGGSNSVLLKTILQPFKQIYFGVSFCCTTHLHLSFSY